jgi:hypothetical protein
MAAEDVRYFQLRSEHARPRFVLAAAGGPDREWPHNPGGRRIPLPPQTPAAGDPPRVRGGAEREAGRRRATGSSATSRAPHKQPQRPPSSRAPQIRPGIPKPRTAAAPRGPAARGREGFARPRLFRRPGKCRTAAPQAVRPGILFNYVAPLTIDSNYCLSAMTQLPQGKLAPPLTELQSKLSKRGFLSCVARVRS